MSNTICKCFSCLTITLVSCMGFYFSYKQEFTQIINLNIMVSKVTNLEISETNETTARNTTKPVINILYWTRLVRTNVHGIPVNGWEYDAFRNCQVISIIYMLFFHFLNDIHRNNERNQLIHSVFCSYLPPKQRSANAMALQTCPN